MGTALSRINWCGILRPINRNYGQKRLANFCNLITLSSVLLNTEYKLEHLYLCDICPVRSVRMFESVNLYLLGIPKFHMEQMRHACKIINLKIYRRNSTLYDLILYICIVNWNFSKKNGSPNCIHLHRRKIQWSATVQVKTDSLFLRNSFEFSL